MIQTVIEQTGINDREIIKELIDDFLTSSIDLLEKLESAHSAERYSDIYMHAHNFRGMAGNLGFKIISSYAERLELLAKENDTDAIGLWLSKLQHEIETLHTAWKEQGGNT